MLSINLKLLETEDEVKEIIKNKENVMICCGRMGPMCIPVYKIMEELESEYSHVTFCTQEVDAPCSGFILKLPECRSFMGLPFTIYFKNGKVSAATSSIQNKKQVVEILNREFGPTL